MPYIQIAENQAMSQNLYTCNEYPSDANFPDNDNGNALGALDGEGVIQYPFGDFRECSLTFECMPLSVYEQGAGSILFEFKSRKYKKTGLEYYLRLEPETTDTIAYVYGENVTLTTGGLIPNEYQYMDLIDANYEAFMIKSHTENILTVELEGRTPSGACYIIDRMHNPLKTSSPIKVRINDVIEKLVPNEEEAMYDVIIQFQKCS